jgi:hypothetical protein
VINTLSEVDAIPAGLEYSTRLHSQASYAHPKSRRIPAEQIGIPFVVMIEQLCGRFDAYLKAEPENLLREQDRLLAAQQFLQSIKPSTSPNRSSPSLRRYVAA